MSVEKPSGHPTAHFILTLPVPHTGTQGASTSISGPPCQLPRLQSASKFSLFFPPHCQLEMRLWSLTL